MLRYLSYRRSITLLAVLCSLMAVLLASLPAAAQDPVGTRFPPVEGTQWSEPQALGDGELRAFVTLTDSGDLDLVGVYFDESALTNLPKEVGDGRWDIVDEDGEVLWHCCGHEFILDFADVEAAAPFKHVVVNWNPIGHQPPGVYDISHFDLHFYTITNEDRTAIEAATADTMCSVPNPPDVGGEAPGPVTCETFAAAMMPLPEEQMPPGYISVGAVEPGMGNHLLNAAAPEMTGEAPFTQTWIYGTYAGKITFFEPMITLAFLEEQPEEVCAEIAMPEAMPESGFYPSQYCIRYMAGEDDSDGAYAVTLEDFVEYE
jgi:hypothetical protein